MKKLILLVILVFLFILNVGYYRYYDEFSSHTRFFIKYSPTLKVGFQNILENNDDFSELERVPDDLRQVIIDYCKYRLGIETELKTQADLDRCAKL